jgi:hypothetical protein
VHALGVLLRVQERESRAVALAEQVDALVAEGGASFVDVSEHLGDGVTAGSGAFGGEPRRAFGRSCGNPLARFDAEYVATGVAECPGDLRAVELGAAVDSAVADHDDVSGPDEPCRRFEAQVGHAGAATETEHGYRVGVGAACLDAADGERDRACVGAVSALGHRDVVEPVAVAGPDRVRPVRDDRCGGCRGHRVLARSIAPADRRTRIVGSRRVGG